MKSSRILKKTEIKAFRFQSSESQETVFAQWLSMPHKERWSEDNSAGIHMERCPLSGQPRFYIFIRRDAL